MKKRFLTLFVLPILLFASCSSSDKAPNNDWVPDAAQRAFEQKYGDKTIVSYVKWEKEATIWGQYLEAEFWQDINGKHYEVEAYFEDAGAWKFTKTDLRKDINDPLVPAAVREGLKATPQATWVVDDIDLFEFNHAEDVFVLEMEQGKNEIPLVFNREGQIVEFPLTGGPGNIEVSDATRSKFEQEFGSKLVPSTTPKWKNKEGYKVVEFKSYIEGRKYEVEAWYNNNGGWFMTETEFMDNINDPLIPAKVRDALNNSDYSEAKGWRVDDIDRIERADAPTVFIIEMEKGSGKTEEEVKLYINLDGIIVNTVFDYDSNSSNGGLIAGQIDPEIKKYLDANFPNHFFSEIELKNKPEGWVYEVEIYHDGREKEVFFGKDSKKWMWTEWELKTKHGDVIPQAIINAVKRDFPFGKIDDVDFVTKPTGKFYRVEVEQGNKETKVLYTEQGVQVK